MFIQVPWYLDPLALWVPWLENKLLIVLLGLFVGKFVGEVGNRRE